MRQEMLLELLVGLWRRPMATSHLRNDGARDKRRFNNRALNPEAN
jgi:hypothetical protein